MAKLEKIEDLQFNGNHPNNINKGYVKELQTIGKAPRPIIGRGYFLGSFYSSPVIAILVEDADGCTFKTHNSVYKLTY